MTGVEAAKGRLRDLLEKVQEFIAKFSPERFTVGLGGITGSDILLGS